MGSSKEWQDSVAKVFWGEIAPCEHVLQIYEDEESFLQVLTDFVGEGINLGEGVIVIATQKHLNGLEAKLLDHGLNVKALIETRSYIPLDEKETLALFMVEGWPDEARFNREITSIINRAKAGNRGVRAFGEMVALLWAEGNNGATVNLEYLWNKLVKTEAFSLFCAYPRAGFTQNATDSVMGICHSHSKMIKGSDVIRGKILYKDSKNIGAL
ncbi:MEDS domain-containing protein [Pedobacter sp. SYSU D00535]|uniref:MEDS domain-containing protein n=1 Tax=Pedobacter sp. SYSU D00535 TaxID=2810308 RepID=UPI001A968BED|nr:MEDS domain-containing protein [Pedobacter sp. SYSU D00535]